MAHGHGLRDHGVLIFGDSAEAAALATALLACGARPMRAAKAGAPLALVSACHPFDDLGPDAALALARRLGLPHLALARPLWRPGPGDRWIRARNPVHAARLLPARWRRVFLAVGRDRIAPFAEAGTRAWFVRAQTAPSHRPPERLLRHAALIDNPGPYAPTTEARLLRRLGIDALVVRNAGGDGARPKVLGARMLGLPVVLIDPPRRAPPGAHADVAGVMAALSALAAAR